MKRAIFPGSFDPLHEGHLNIIDKALKLFDVIYVVVTNNPEKKHQTLLETRFKNVSEKLKDKKNVIVEINANQSTAIFAKEKDIFFLIRSARDKKDYQYELQLASGNHFLNHNLETILIIPDYEKINFRSRLIKQKIKT